MLEQINFEVSAKTARLIGRENISGVNGALLELIKNSYDADASLCKVLFSVPFPSVRPSFKADIVREVLDESDFSFFIKYYAYNQESDLFKASRTFTDVEIAAIQNVLFKYNKIIVLDNGSGMTKEIIKKSWMRIGTNDKEIEFVSEKGRVKTGAKGIGRFALDKLSTKTLMYTKSKSDFLTFWEIDWNAFDRSRNLSEISANISSIKDKTYENIVLDTVGSKLFEQIKNYGFDTGTIIILSPTREPWSDRLIKTLNNNLRGINPFQNSDKFDVTIENIFYPEHSFSNVDLEMRDGDYDYFVKADFDGNSTIEMVINRSELDLSAQDFVVESSFAGEKKLVFSYDKFWSRSKFDVDGYKKSDYSKPFNITIDVSQITSNYLLSDINKLGKFHFEFYFMKNANSDLEITKRINLKRRKEILDLFSGIKIYRDNFKVRPYGDKDTSYYDWIGLGERSQKSPAAVTHKDSPWRVEPYQIVGSLSIGRLSNPYLTDMANREGLNPNEPYHILVDLLQAIISHFEYDRQYFLREFKAARDELKKKADNRIQQIIESYTSKTEGDGNSGHGSARQRKEDQKDFSKEEIGKAIQHLVSEKENDITGEDVMMLLSVSGTATNTFAHEIGALEALIGGFPSQMRACIRRLVKEEDYHGSDLFNPYLAINEYERTTKILSSWIGTLIRGVKEENLKLEIVDVNNCVKELLDGWRDLLATKYIELILNEGEEHIKSRLRKSDLFLILNNFILNSSWFVEGTPEKKVFIDLIDDGDSYVIQMENSGAPIEEKYKDNPYKMFELRETTKVDKNGKRIGTGIGLWMLQKTVAKYDGQIFFHQLKHGTFGFSIKMIKENNK